MMKVIYDAGRLLFLGPISIFVGRWEFERSWRRVVSW